MPAPARVAPVRGRSAARAALPLLLFVPLAGCGSDAPEPAPSPDLGTPTAAGGGDEGAVGAEEGPSAASPPEAPTTPASRAGAPPATSTGYAGDLRRRLLAGEAAAVREAVPPGALAAVSAIRRALIRVDPDRRAAAVAAVGTLAELFDTRRDFLLKTTAVDQGGTPGVNLPGWAAPVLRAVAAGPASTADPAAITDEDLLDGTVAALLRDEAFRQGLKRWTVRDDAPARPPAGDAGDEDEAATATVVLTDGAGGESVIPLVASGGRWVPAVVEATVPVWAAKADSAGGTGAAAVLAAAGPHLESALAAESQEAFDGALRAATDAALAAADGPPGPVPAARQVTVDLTHPLTARQAADLLLRFEAAVDDPARAVGRAAPRSGGPGWRVTVGPVADVAAWVARLPELADAAVDGRTVTVAFVPPEVEPEPPQPDGAEVEPRPAGGAD